MMFPCCILLWPVLAYHLWPGGCILEILLCHDEHMGSFGMGNQGAQVTSSLCTCGSPWTGKSSASDVKRGYSKGLMAFSENWKQDELSERGRYCTPWSLQGVHVVCVINESIFHTFPSSIPVPSDNTVFHVLLTLFEIYEAKLASDVRLD